MQLIRSYIFRGRRQYRKQAHGHQNEKLNRAHQISHQYFTTKVDLQVFRQRHFVFVLVLSTFCFHKSALLSGITPFRFSL